MVPTTRSLLALAVLATCATSVSAGMLDLTTLGASGSINGAVFTQGNSHVTGTGNVDPFVRIQANDTEQGYNTSGSPVPFADKASFVRDLRLGDVGILPDGASGFVAQFHLDINQNGGNASLLSLDRFQIYLTTDPSQTTTSFLPNGDLALTGATKVYDMDGPDSSDNFLKLDASLHQGSGLHDLTIDLPIEALRSFDPATTYLVLFARFGDNFISNDGFEEFWYDKGTDYTFDNPPPVPEPASVSLLALGAVALLVRRRRR